MTRKHFKAIAQALANERPEPSWTNKRTQWEKDIDAIANELGKISPKFDFEKFMEACKTWPYKE